MLGGTSWLTRFAARGAPADFDAWAAGGNPGWSFSEVLPTFRRVESDGDFGDNSWHGVDGPIPIARYPTLRRSDIHAAALEALSAMGFPTVMDHNAPGAVGVGPFPMSSRNGVRVTSVDAYLPVDEDRPGLSIRGDSPVATVDIDGGRVTGVRLADGSDVSADRVVLAAGTYASPSILLRSGIGPDDHLRPLGIGTRIALPGVGANLADHPAIDLDTGWQGSATVGPVLHSMATFRSAGAPPDGAPDLMFWVSDPAGDAPGFYADPILLKPRSRGTVRLGLADPAAPPLITLPGVRDPVDLERMAEGYRIGVELANRPEIRRLATGTAPTVPGSPAEMRERLLENAYSIPHVVGTCRMGPSPDDGDVVDALGRVHGVDGLYVVDASIMPDAPSGFPHLITIMLAEHLSATLLQS